MAEPLRHELQFLQDDRARTAWVRVLTSNQGVWDQTQKPKYIYGTALYFASSLGHKACVEWLLKQTEVDLNALAGPYNTALQAASANGHQTIVDMLLRHGANPNVLRSLSLAYTVTALCAAATHGHHGVVISLLAHGAGPNIDSDEPFRDRPLYAAAEHGHTDVVASLLQAGAEVNHYGSHRGTAIRVAAEKGFDRIVDLLLGAGSGVDDADEVHLLTPLMAALDAGHTTVARRLIESETVVTIADGHGVTALERAAEYGHIDLLDLMLKIGLGVDWQGAKSSALMAAIRYGYVDGVQILIQHGASVHASREPTFTPLCAACLYGREEIADLLIKTGAQVNLGADLETGSPESSPSGEETESSYEPWTVRVPPLYRAAWRGHVGVVSLLLRAGAAVDARRSGSTALQEACYRGHAGVVRLLLEAGADVDANAGEFGTPMQVAVKFGRNDVIRVLEVFEMQDAENE
jgi:ankyrin repeat protein